MRKMMTVLAAAMVLTGCGTQNTLTGPHGVGPRAAAMQAKTANAPFFAVQPGEAIDRNAVDEAMGRFFHDKAIRLPLGPKDELERVSSVMIHHVAGRKAARGAREFVGEMTVSGDHVPNTFITHQKELKFRLTLAADKRVVRFDFEGVSLDGLRILKPAFGAVAPGEAARLKADVLAFLKPTTKPGDNVFAALFGLSDRYESSIAGVKATSGAFGDFGRVVELQMPLRHKDGGLFHTYTFIALLDQQGRVVSVN